MCHLKRIRRPGRPRRSNAAPGLHRRWQPHPLHQGARQARPVHAGRSRGAMRPAAAAAPAVRAGRVRPGDPRLRQRDRRRDEPGARRRVAARHGRSDARLHRADQLRLRHAIDRHRLPLYPGRPVGPDPGRRRGSAEPRTADFQSPSGRLVCPPQRRARSMVEARGDARIPPFIPDAGDRPRTWPHRSDHRPQHGTDRRTGRASLSHHAAAGRRIRRRKPEPIGPRAARRILQGRDRACLRPRRHVVRPR